VAERAARAALRILLSCLVLLTSARVLPAEDAVLAGRVLRVVDGDTLDVLLDSGRIRVRLHGVDAPEHDQPGGAEARQWLERSVLNRDVLLEPVTQDRYERLVAVVHLQDVVLNRELLRLGHGWAYRSYLRAGDRELCDIEFRARLARSGLWSRTVPQAPWEYRATRGRGPFTDYSRQSAKHCWSQRRQY
jgi:endonuclease YncB( thermonuclease family)